jgi:hypothetical protein
MEQKALEITEAKLEEYRHSQNAETRRLEALADDSKKLDSAIRLSMDELSIKANDIVTAQETLLSKAAEEMEQKALEITEAKLEEYRLAQSAETRRLEALADDSKKLDSELRLSMDELSAKAKDLVTSQESLLTKVAGEMEQKALEITGAKLEEYRLAQGAESRRLESLADDSKKLDSAIRLSMDELSEKAKDLVTTQEALLAKAAGEMEQKALEITEAKLEKYLHTQDAELRRLESLTEDSRKLDFAIRESMDELSVKANDLVTTQEALLLKAAGEMEQKALEITEAKLEKYRNAQDAESRRLESLTEDSRKLDSAFRLSMDELSVKANDLVTTQEALLLKAAGEMEQKTLEITEAKLEKYRHAQDAELRRLESLAGDSKKLDSAIRQSMDDLSEKAKDLVSTQEALLVKAAEEMKQKALEITEAKLEEYRRAQDAEFRRLESLADDSRKLDSELRLSMQEVVNRVRGDFANNEREFAAAQKAEADKFTAAAAALREEITEVETRLSALKTAAYDNVSEKLRVIENDFSTELSKKGAGLDQRLAEWQGGLESRLSQMAEEAFTGRKEFERAHTEEMKKTFSVQGERLVSDLERLKSEIDALEEGIRMQMNSADESVVSLKEQMTRSFEDAKGESDVYIRSEISKNSLATAETIKQYQRELDARLHEMSDFVQARNTEVSALIDNSRSDLDKTRNELGGKVRELDNDIEEARQRVRDLSAETDNRISSVRSAVEDAERQTANQAKLIDKTHELRLEMERRIEDMKGDIDRLDQRRAEAFQLENDFVKIKRLEDDVNAKMTRFLTEKRRIETMEADFSRLLQISRAVEEKLAHVTASDDTLQGVQLQIRKLEETLAAAEEKYQRIERKGQILDTTNDGIDRNFKVLQDSEKVSAKIGVDLARYAEDLGSIKTSIEKLAGESEKAQEAANKIEVLDNLLEEIEERIKSLQRARQWIADSETRLEELNRQAQTQARAVDSLVKGKKTAAPRDTGGGTKLSTQQLKEDVVNLARQGWKADEIAKAMKISRGEVELILDMAPRDL